MRRGEAVRVGIATGAIVAVLAYATIRVLERALFPEPNPAMVLWSERNPFFWRAAIALYLGGAGVFGGFAAWSRSSSSAARALFGLLVLALAALVLQGALSP